MAKKLRRLGALLLVLAMCSGMLGVSALADVPVAEDVPATHQTSCAACGGSGKIVDDATSQETNCTACSGTGQVTCSGTYELDMDQTTATCAASGKAVYVCPVCGDEFVQSNVILDHEPTTVTTITPATCTQNGEEECYCEICDATYTRSIPALGHDLDETGHCTRCDYATTAVGGTFTVDDCWEQYNNQPKFDTFSLTCKVLTAAENGENGTVAVTGWAGAEGNTSSTNVYILIPPTVTDDLGNEYTVTQVTANFQMNQANQNKGKLMGFYLKAPEVKELSVNSMFANQTNLQVLDLGDSLEVIGVGCFSGCKKLGYSSSYPVVLPESLKEIGSSAFKGMTLNKQGTLDIPASVTYIGTGAFENSSLEAITGGEGLTSLSSTVFQFCYSLTTVDFPNVTEFGSAVFYNSGLTNVGWDWSQITVLDDDTFGGCYGLTGDLVLSGDCELGWSTFAGTGFSSVTIGEGMTEIPNWAFCSCFNLTEVNLPNSLTTIGQEAFAWPGEGEVTVTIGSDNASRLSEVKSGAFADGTFNITVHTSEDSIANTANLGDNVTYTVASIETTKEASDLQTLIDEAASGDTIDLTESYDINAQVTIPADKAITLTSSNGSVLKGTVNGYMFDVPATASLTLGEGLSVMVRNARLVESAGTFTLSGAAVTGGSAGRNEGVVHITEGGVFNMNSGSISGAVVTNQYAGTVLLSQGAEMTMTGGKISNNNAEGQLNSGAGVTVCQGATFTMEGGTISENTAFRGAGVLVFGGTNSDNPAYNADTAATFIMNGGTISGNTVSGWLNNLRAAGGGVYVQENAQFTMNAGTISGNTSDHQGGGVATQDEDGNGGVFTMNGGTISDNKAVNGGGVYSYSKAVKLLSGRIENNEASGLGGGMYVSTDPYSIQLGDALITSNTATVMGGGIWSCPIGTIDFADGHFAIYENTAGGAGDDVAALNKDADTITTLGSNMPGGGVMAWYEDAKISAIQLNGEELGAIVTGSLRYADGTPRIDAPVDSRDSFSAKAIVTDDAKALVSASLIITGNKASQGGGIGSNGIVTLSGSSVEPESIPVTKVWAGDVNPNQPDSVTVELVMTIGESEYVVDTAQLNEANNWSFTFRYVPQANGVYTVREIVPAGYESAVTVDEDTGTYTITNTYHSPVIPGPSTHTLTVHYVDTEGNTLLDTTITTYNTGVPYSVSIPDIEGYTYLYSEGDALSGYMNMDRVVTLVYEPGDVDIDEPDTPLDPGPGDGDGDGDIDIDEPDVPLDPGDEIDIDDGDVPLDDAPQTGDSAPLLILASLLAISGGAVLTLSLTGKKKES